MKWFEGFTKSEWRILSLSLVLMMVCAFMLSNERVLNRIGMGGVRRAPIAELVDVKGDVRWMLEGTKAWGPPDKALHLGEALWLEEGARVHLRLRVGTEVHISGKALVRAVLMEGVASLDMIAGQFDWLIDGEQSVGVGGTRGLLKGEAATLSLQVDAGQEPQVRLTSGRGGLQMSRTFEGPDESGAPIPAPTANSVYFYIWRLEDFYTVVEQRLNPQPHPPLEVPLEVPLNWDHTAVAGPFAVQVAASEDFTQQRRFFSAAERTLALDRVLLGNNFWRVSYNGRSWSEGRSFRVEARFITVRITPHRTELNISLSKSLKAPLAWSVSDPMAGYVLQVSEDRDFGSEVNTRWLTTPEFNLELDKPGVWYARLRGFNARQELSDWGPIMKIRAH